MKTTSRDQSCFRPSSARVKYRPHLALASVAQGSRVNPNSACKASNSRWGVGHSSVSEENNGVRLLLGTDQRLFRPMGSPGWLSRRAVPVPGFKALGLEYLRERGSFHEDNIEHISGGFRGMSSRETRSFVIVRGDDESSACPDWMEMS